ncbi:MAG: DUF898 family protein [Pseudomonadota bacterium]
MTNQEDYGWATRFPSVARRAAPESAAPEPAPASVAYDLDGQTVFKAGLRGAALMVPTLGLHRFWMLTRLRRMFWNAIRIDGEPLEYTGRPSELIFGFLVAVVILAVILGGANLALVFAGLVGGFDLGLAFNASLPLLIPLGYYAQYRARRYLAARTRWRGIRFGMAPGAATYALHATGHLLLTIATLGILYPRMQVLLARRQQESTWYGNIRFRQEADWRRLMTPWLVIWIPVLLAIGNAFRMGLVAFPELQATLDDGADDPVARAEAMERLGFDIVSMFGVLAIVGVVAWPLLRRYGAAEERELMGGLSLGPARFASTLRTGALLGLDVRTMLVYLLVAVLGGILVSSLVMTISLAGVVLLGGQIAILLATAASYAFILIAFVAVGWLARVHWPVKARLEALTITGADRLSEARQREDDAAREGGGFADALDVGAGF